MAPNAQHSFYARVGQLHGQTALELFKSYASSYTKLGNMLSRKDFLIRCRRDGLMPVHIIHSLKCAHELLAKRSPLHKKLSRTLTRLQKAILNIEIQDTFYQIQQLRAVIDQLKRQIMDSTPAETYKQYLFTQEFAFYKNFQRKTQQTHRKFHRMLNDTVEETTTTPSLNEKAIFNATNKQIPPETNILLSLGPKFALPYTEPRDIPYFHLIADLENILTRQEDRTVRERTRCQIINVMQNHINKRPAITNTTALDKFCSRSVLVTRRFTKTNPDIIITEADKGNRTVIMYKEDYNNKLLQLVTDTSVYRPVKNDPTSRIQTHNNDIAKRLFDLKLIDTRTKLQLTSYNAICPRIYGQPKAHKPNLPLRPVVPNVTSPTYHLAKFVSSILQRGFTSIFNVKDSRTFCQYVNNTSVPPDHIIVSFDVVSLFTNIPKYLVTHDIIMSWPEISPHTNISLDIFLEIVEFLIDSSYFCFQNNFYTQLLGTAMGSPLSPILADITTETLLLVATTTAKIPVDHIRKYVDDLFLILHRDQVDDVLNVFNQYDPHLQFTCEVEKEGKLPFLDLLVIRNPDNTLTTEWYAKPISSGRLLNFHSMHPLDQKLGVVSNFIDRVRTFSTATNVAQQNQLILQHLRRNDYPTHLVKRMLHQPIQSTPTRTEDPLAVYRSIPLIPGLSTTLKRIITHNIPHTMVATKSRHTIKQLHSSVKDPVPHLQKHNVIYQIQCQNCEQCYIGMTTNNLRRRMYGHQSYINALDKKLLEGYQYSDVEVQQLREKTALIEHCILHQHRFNLKQPHIIDHSYKTSALPVLEMCHITTTSNTVNRRTDTDGLSCAYANCLSMVGSSRRRPPNTNTTANLAQSPLTPLHTTPTPLPNQ